MAKIIAAFVILCQVLLLSATPSNEQDILHQNYIRGLLKANGYSSLPEDIYIPRHYSQNPFVHFLGVAAKWISDRSSGLKVPLRSQCAREIDAFAAGLLGSDQQALRAMDAFGSIPAGVMDGNIKWTGSYDQCIRVDITTNVTGPTIRIRGKHCMANWFYNIYGAGVCLPSSCNTTEIQYLVEQVKFTWVVVPENSTFVCTEPMDIGRSPGAIVAFFVIGIFLCLVITGTAFDVYIQNFKQTENEEKSQPMETFKKTNVETGEAKDNLTFQVSNGEIPTVSDNKVYCNLPRLNSNGVTVSNGNIETGVIHTDQKPKCFENKDRTSYSLQKSMSEVTRQNKCKDGLKKILLSFSFYTNGRNLMNMHHTPGSYKALHGIRFLSFAWIVLGHTYTLGIWLVPQHIAANINAYNEHLRPTFFHQIIEQMNLAVEAFFVLSGFLVTVSFLKSLKYMEGKIKWHTIPLLWIHRYWRLTPVYAILLMMWTVFFPYMAQGPLHYPGILVDECPRTWWANIFYVNNLVPGTQGCFGWAWYLACDWQFYFVSPFFLLVVYKWRRIGRAIIGLLIPISLGISFYVLHRVFKEGTGDHYMEYYIKPHTRMGPYMQGMLLGTVYYQNKFKFKVPKALVVLGWLGAFAVTFLAVFIRYSEVCPGCSWPPEAIIAFRGLFRNVFALGVIWVVFACIAGYGGFVNTVLSWEGFLPLSRISYVGYLLHPMIIYFTIHGGQNLVYVRHWNMIYYFIGHLVLSVVGSALISLVFEVPMLGVESVVLPSRKKGKQN